MTSNIEQFRQKFTKAQSLHKGGMFQGAEAAYLELLASGIDNERILRSLTQLYLHGKKEQAAATCFEKLINIAPDQPQYYENLANLYHHLGDGNKAISCYRRLLKRQPRLADSHYNLGILLKQYQFYDEAVAAYQNALDYGIERPEEVYLNMGVIYSDHLRQEQKARFAMEAALKVNPNYISAMFNLASMYEEAGDKSAAQDLFQRIIDLDPFYYSALARLGEVKTFTDSEDPLILKMKQVARKSSVDISIRTNLYFALGKALNGCGAFDDAFACYELANQYNKQTVTPYDRAVQEQMTNDLIMTFNKKWFDDIEPVSDAAPIFICGMFRSGSTLTEQILASHPMVTAGGEVDFFVREIRNTLEPYPVSLSGIEPGKLAKLAQKYLDHLKKTFPTAKNITDKRPDNFLHLGLLKSLYPKARIIYTSRNATDNCLSVFFLRLGNAMNYATDLKDTAHYYKQSTRLVSHWKSMFGENIHEVNYDELVKNPQTVIEDMLEFCDLEWSEDCLEFHKLDNVVKTASVWQVREPLYQKSSGRWRNFETHLSELQQALKSE